MNCISYLETVHPQFKAILDSKMSKGERPDSRIKSLWLECQKRSMQLQNAIGAGQLSEEDYLGIQNAQLEKDKKLLAYFKATGSAKKAALVQERIGLIQQELSGE